MLAAAQEPEAELRGTDSSDAGLTLCDAGFVGQREGAHVRYVLVLRDGGEQPVTARLTCLDGSRLPLGDATLTSGPLAETARETLEETPQLRAVEQGLGGGRLRHFCWRIEAPARRRGARYFGLGFDVGDQPQPSQEEGGAEGRPRPCYYAERTASKLCLGASPVPFTHGFFLTAGQAERRLAELARIGAEHGVFSRTPDEVSCDTLTTLLLRLYSGSDRLLLSVSL